MSEPFISELRRLKQPKNHKRVSKDCEKYKLSKLQEQLTMKQLIKYRGNQSDLQIYEDEKKPKAIRMQINFTKNFSIRMNLPQSLQIKEFEELIESFAKLHLKFCPSQKFIYAGLEIKGYFFESKSQDQSLDPCEASEAVEYKISKYVLQNVMLHSASDTSSENSKGNLGEFRIIEEQLSLSKTFYPASFRQKVFQNCQQDLTEKTYNVWVRYEKINLQIGSSFKRINPFQTKDLKNKQQLSSLLSKKFDFQLSEDIKTPDIKTPQSSNKIKKQKLSYLQQNRHAFSRKPSLQQNENIYIEMQTEENQILPSSKINQDQILQPNQFQLKKKEDFVTFKPKNMSKNNEKSKSEKQKFQRIVQLFSSFQVSCWILLKNLVMQQFQRYFQESLTEKQNLQMISMIIRQQKSVSFLYCFERELSCENQENDILEKVTKNILINAEDLLDNKVQQFYQLSLNQRQKPNQKKINLRQTKDYTKQQSQFNKSIWLILAANSNQRCLPIANFIKNLLSFSHFLEHNEKKTNHQHQWHIESIKNTMSDIEKQANKLIKLLAQQIFMVLKKELKTQQPKLNPNSINCENEENQKKKSESLVKVKKGFNVRKFLDSVFWKQKNSSPLPQPKQKTKFPVYGVLQVFSCKYLNSQSHSSILKFSLPQLAERLHQTLELDFHQGQINSSLAEFDLQSYLKDTQKKLLSQFKQLAEQSIFPLLKFEKCNNFILLENSKKSQLQKLKQIPSIISLKQIQTQQNNDRHNFAILNSTFPNWLQYFVRLFLSNLFSEIQSSNDSYEERYNFELQTQSKKENAIFSKLKEKISNLQDQVLSRSLQLKCQISKAIENLQIQLKECYCQPKTLFFYKGDQIDTYDKQTTLKKKKLNPARNYENSVLLTKPFQVNPFQTLQFQDLIKQKPSKKVPKGQKQKKFKQIKAASLSQNCSKKKCKKRANHKQRFDKKITKVRELHF